MELNKNKISKETEARERSKSVTAFARSTRVGRSPEKGQTQAVLPPRVQEESGSESSTTQVVLPDDVPKETVAPITQQSNVVNLDQAEEKLEELLKFVMGRSNIHGGIRVLILQAIELLVEAKVEEARKLDTAEKRAEAAEARAEAAEMALRNKASRSLPAPPAAVAGPSGGTPSGTIQPAGKRLRDTPEDPDKKKAKKKKGTGAVQPTGGQSSADKVLVHDKDADGWRKVEKRKKKPKPSAVPATKPRRVWQKPEAILIGEAVGTSYADILRKVKEDPSLQELGEKVVAVRRTQKGDLLFELKRDRAVHSADFKQKVEQVLGESAKVRALSQEIAIECRGMDEVTTADDLRRALVKDLSLEGVDLSISMRRSFNKSQAATIRLPEAAANKALRIGKVKVGWTRCALRLPAQVTRCFKCMGFGHHALNCKGPDRSDQCRRCGGKGHKAVDCSKAPKCMLCPAGSNDHPTGGGMCPAFKKAKDGRKA